jgi:hypothetical protein
MARDSKNGDESAGYGGSTCSGGKTASSPDKEDVLKVLQNKGPRGL